MANTYTNHKGVKSALSAPPESGQEEYKDTTASGLYLRVYSTGLGVFIHRYKINAQRRVFTLAVPEISKATKETELSAALIQARAIHAQQRTQIKAGIDPAIDRDLKAQELVTTPTVSEFADTYIQRYAKPKKKSWAEDERQLRADVIPALGSLKIDAVRRGHVIALLDKKEDAGALVARNRLLSLLSKYFAFAFERDLIQENPAKGIKKLDEEARTRVLSDNEVHLLWQWLHSNKCDLATNSALKLALITGQRVDEICSMQEKHIQGDWWLIPDPKNSVPHTVFLTDRAKQIIEELRPHSRKGYLLINREGEPKDSSTLPAVMESAKVAWEKEPRPTPHDLRRTLTTGISRLGFNRLVQDKVTNHKDSSVGGIYDRYDYAKEKQQALEAWARKLDEIIHGHTADNVLTFQRA